MNALNTLTVQDILWLHLQITQGVYPFAVLPLEEASFYQFSYGTSTDLPAQAGRFLAGFVRQAPFPLGNEACAFVACLSFLELNGKRLALPADEAQNWFADAKSSSSAAEGAILEKLVDSGQEHHLMREIEAKHDLMLGILVAYAEVVERLVANEAPRALEPVR